MSGKWLPTGILIVVAVLVGATWLISHKQPKTVYDPNGYGGMRPAGSVSGKSSPTNSDPLAGAQKAYNSGNYKQAEAEAFKVVNETPKNASAQRLKQTAEAKEITAFASARTGKMSQARERFGDLKAFAKTLPKVKEKPVPGEPPSPEIVERAAYQHAVCTAALGDKEAAQNEYLKFMLDYPESPLLNGVVLRLRKLNDGHLPDIADKTFQKASKIAEARRLARAKEEAMCGPECLAEFLRRFGKTADPKTLARQMATDENGTSLAAFAKAAGQHGVPLKGVRLTWNGLKKQFPTAEAGKPLAKQQPVVAYVQPGHFVIIESIQADKVTIWDPNAQEDSPGTATFTSKDFQMRWPGIALVVGKPKK